MSDEREAIGRGDGGDLGVSFDRLLGSDHIIQYDYNVLRHRKALKSINNAFFDPEKGLLPAARMFWIQGDRLRWGTAG